jgi:signal transduction histidine kinase
LNRSPGDAAVTAKAGQLIDRQVHHMSRLVSDLLDAARSQNGQIKLQRTALDLRSSIEHVVDLMGLRGPSRLANKRLSGPITGVGRGNRLSCNRMSIGSE